MWAGVYATYDRTNQRYRIERDARRMRHGWRVKVLWVVSTDLESPARVRGHELGGGTSLWFEVEDRGETPVATATLDGAAPGGSTTTGYRDFPSYMYVPRAGCYELEASWSDGSWQLVFGLGG